jgi:drug/metabolite transporter (DMT)-like permease
LGGGQLDGITTAYQRILGGLLVSGLFLLAVKHGSLWSARPKIHPGTPQANSNALTKWRLVWVWVMINAISGPALGVSCYQWALETRPTGLVLPVVAITPLVVVPFARYMEGERPTKRSLLGGLVAVIGAVLLTVVSR